MILSADEFVRLRRSEDPEEYGRAASEEASVSVWLDVINKYPGMKDWGAHNKTVPLIILRILSDDPDANVRFAVAFKRKLDRPLFDKLAKDKDESVRHRIAYNKKTPIEVLKQLTADPEEFVREAAKERILQRGQSLL